MIKNFLQTAFRTLTTNVPVSLLNIFGLSAGMTSAVLIFLWVHNELSFDSYHPDAGRIYRITAHITSAKWTWETAPLSLVQPIRTEVPEVETLTAMQPAWSPIFRLGNELVAEKHCAYVDSAWFSVFHYDFVRGNAATFFRHPFSLILTQTKAKKYFGDKDPIGRTIHIDTLDYQVAAVVRDNPANSSLQFDVLIPVDAYLSNPDNRKNDLEGGNFNYLTFLKLRPGANPAKVSTTITGIMNKGAKDQTNSLSLTPLKEIHLETDLTYSGEEIEHGSRIAIDIFTILGIFLLVIACINYVNLTTARASLRAKEVGIRKIVGAGNNSLFLQFILESLIVSAIALLITILLITLLMPMFRELTDRNFLAPLATLATWKIIGLTLLASTVLNGIYPALVLSSFKPLNVLKGVTLLRFKDVYLRRSLVVLQFTFSIILIIGTIVIERQLHYIQSANPGYNRMQVFWFWVPWQEQSQVGSIKQELLSRADISGVAIANNGSVVHITSSNSGSADWDGRDTSFRPTVFQVNADEDYARVMGLQMAQGRWFDTRYPSDKHNFILNETAVAEFINLHKPVLGQRFSFQGDTGKIVGVVKDFHFASLHEKIRPLVFYDRNDWRTSVFIKTLPGKTSSALAEARTIWQRYVPGKPFDYTFLDDEFNSLYRTDQKASTLILVFSVIAILISCLGLVGLAAFTARQRIKEIGIRKVLGASVANIVTLLSRDFLRLVILSVLIATPIAWWSMHQWLQNFAYHIPLGGWTFALAGALAIVIALLTVSSQSIRAATSNPANSLRTD
jgi:putative ABC transport system permease protein